MLYNQTMNGYITNIENETLNSENFRKVLFTGEHMQLVVMTLEPGEDIGTEAHPDIDQFFRVETGVATLVIDGEEETLGPDFVAIVPAGSEHNIINASGEEKLRLYTIYTPPEHKDGTIHRTKQEALEDEHHH